MRLDESVLLSSTEPRSALVAWVSKRCCPVGVLGSVCQRFWGAAVAVVKVFRAYEPDQVLLLAPVLQEWVPEGDLAHFVSDLVESGALDLLAIYASYEDERGAPPYDPR